MIKIPGIIPISIHPLFWLMAFLIGWMSTFTLMGALLAVVVIIISILFHEYGHALTGMVFGQKTRIELAVFGGFTYREGRKLKLWEEFLVVLNGPLFGLILFALSFWAHSSLKIENASIVFLLKFSSMVNLFWTVMNLVPVLPLDGGHLMSIILQSIFGFKGIKIAIVVGIVIGACISIVFFVMGQFLIGALFLLLTFESFRSLRYYKLLSEKDRDDDLQKLALSAEKDFQAGRENEAAAKFQTVREKAQEGILYVSASENLAQILKHQGKIQEAYAMLLPLKKSISQEVIPLLQSLAFLNHDYAQVVKIGKECYQIAPHHETALLNALSSASLGQVEPAVGWLECAIREGLPYLDDVLKRKEFDPIRNDPRFISLSVKQ